MTTYGLPPSPGTRTYGPLLYLMVMLPLVLAIAIGAVVAFQGAGQTGQALPSGTISTERIAAYPEAQLVYPGATNVTHATASGAPQGTGVAAVLAQLLGTQANVTIASTDYAAPASTTAVAQWYHDYLTGHGWCAIQNPTAGNSAVPVTVYRRGSRELFAALPLSGDLVAGSAASQAGATVTSVTAIYAIYSGDVSLGAC